MIATSVLLEKIVPRGEWVSRVAGVILLGWGGWIAAAALGDVGLPDQRET